MAHEERGEWATDKIGLDAVAAAKAWIKSLPPILTIDDLKRPSEEMNEWRESLRSALRRCVSRPGSSRASIIVGHLTDEQKRICLEEVDSVARSAGASVSASVKKGRGKLTIELSGNGSRSITRASELRGK